MKPPAHLVFTDVISKDEGGRRKRAKWLEDLNDMITKIVGHMAENAKDRPVKPKDFR